MITRNINSCGNVKSTYIYFTFKHVFEEEIFFRKQNYTLLYI